jgi:hypothetical protein
MMTVKVIPQIRSLNKRLSYALLLLLLMALLVAPHLADWVRPMWVAEGCLQELPVADEVFAAETALPACWLVN